MIVFKKSIECLNHQKFVLKEAVSILSRELENENKNKNVLTSIETASGGAAETSSTLLGISVNFAKFVSGTSKFRPFSAAAWQDEALWSVQFNPFAAVACRCPVSV